MALATDVLEYEVARAAVGAKAADQDLVALYISAVSQMMDDRFGPVVRRTITDELHDGGMGSVWLRHGPVASVSACAEAQGTSTVTCTQQTFGTQPADGFFLPAWQTSSAPYSGQVVRMSGGAESCWYAGRGNVKVTYSAGRFASTAAVSERFQQAALLAFRNLWRSEQSGVVRVDEYDVPQAAFARFSLPNAVVELLRDELRVPGVA